LVKLLSFGKVKEKMIFLLLFAHLFVTLQPKKVALIVKWI